MVACYQLATLRMEAGTPAEAVSAVCHQRPRDKLELRETALRQADAAANGVRHLGKARGRVSRQADCANYQLVRLGRIGYSLNEQVNYVRTALIMFRLTKTFSRFVLIVGHRGQTEKQPLSSSRVPSMEACRRYKLTDKACPPRMVVYLAQPS